MKTFKRMISCIIVILLLIGVLGKVSDITQRKDSDYKYKPFFEHANDIDVLFVGTSHMLNAVFPMELWNDYGITSYNFGGHSNELATTYWVLMNALDYAKPKVVVVDCFKLISEKKAHSQFEYLHVSLDAFPLSWTKIKAANDLLDDSGMDSLLEEKEIELSEKHTRVGLLWDYSVYHTRWKDLTMNDFEPETTIEYGADSRVRIVEPMSFVNNPGLTTESDSVGETYLKRIIEECQNRDIKVVLAFIPYPIYKEDRWLEINRAAEIADEYGVEYINCIDLGLVDYDTDMYDPKSHLNPSGAMKVTDYFGRVLSEKYTLPDHRGDQQYEYWDEDYCTYREYKNQRLHKQNDLNTYLMLLGDKHYGYIMSIGDPNIFNDTVTMRLLKNKGVDVDKINDDTKYIIICGQNTQVINSDIKENNIYGNITISFDNNGEYSIHKGPEKLCTLSTDTLSRTEQAITVNAFELSNSNQIIDTSTFAIEKTTDPNERKPDDNGVVVLNSRARRIKQ